MNTGGAGALGARLIPSLAGGRAAAVSAGKTDDALEHRTAAAATTLSSGSI